MLASKRGSRRVGKEQGHAILHGSLPTRVRTSQAAFQPSRPMLEAHLRPTATSLVSFPGWVVFPLGLLCITEIQFQYSSVLCNWTECLLPPHHVGAPHKRIYGVSLTEVTQHISSSLPIVTWQPPSILSSNMNTEQVQY